jgi:hypothetical protein
MRALLPSRAASAASTSYARLDASDHNCGASKPRAVSWRQAGSRRSIGMSSASPRPCMAVGQAGTSGRQLLCSGSGGRSSRRLLPAPDAAVLPEVSSEGGDQSIGEAPSTSGRAARWVAGMTSPYDSEIFGLAVPALFRCGCARHVQLPCPPMRPRQLPTPPTHPSAPGAKPTQMHLACMV